MPSLPTKNSAPECSFDAYRRYLPPSYRHSFELYIPNPSKTLFISYCKFLVYCALYVMIFFTINWIFVYLSNYIADDREYRSEGFTFLHDLYWFILLSLYCFCITFICFPQIPREHIHVQFIMNFFTKYWTMSLYFTSLFITMICFSIHYLLKVLEWNKNEISSNHNLDKILTHWNIYCNIFMCEDWTLSRVVTYTIIPPFALFFNFFLLHYWLFGFHKDGYYDRYKNQQQLQPPHTPLTPKETHEPKEIMIQRKTNINSNYNPLSNDNDNNDDPEPELSQFSSVENGINRSMPIAINNSLSNNKSLSIHKSNISTHSKELHHSNPSHPTNLPQFSIDSIEEQQENKSMSRKLLPNNNDIMSNINNIKSDKNTTTSSALSAGMSSDVTAISHNTMLSRSSPLNSMMNKSFIAFKYPETLLLKWISLYCLIFMSVNAIFNALSNVQNRWYNEYFVHIFIFILFSTSILKWMMKRIARLIDASRSNKHPLTSKSKQTIKIGSRSSHDPLSNQFTDQLQSKHYYHSSHVSLELCTELYMDFVFYLTYRELMMYYIPKLDEFFKVSLYFFAHEIWICSIRPSSTYYKFSKYIQNSYFIQRFVSCMLCNNLRDGKHHNYDDERSDLSGTHSRSDTFRSVDPETLKKRLLFFNWRDDSTLLQWQIRCSLDITIRILAGIVSSVVIITEVLILGAAHFKLEKNNWKIGILYIALSATIQLVYFALVYVWNFYIQQFPLLEPWWSLQINNQKTWKFVCIVLIAIAFWLPDL